MSGNVPEWTMESYSDGLSRVSRGGLYKIPEEGHSASERGAWAPVICGFRITLYIK